MTDTATLGTIEHIDPNQIKVETNIRTTVKLDPAFVASIREYGVLTPVGCRRNEDGTVALRIGQRRVLAAREVVAGRVHRTPMLSSATAARILGIAGGPAVADARIHLKAEHLQVTGSFKPRGMTNKVASLTAEERTRGIDELPAPAKILLENVMELRPRGNHHDLFRERLGGSEPLGRPRRDFAKHPAPMRLAEHLDHQVQMTAQHADALLERSLGRNLAFILVAADVRRLIIL